LSAFDKAAIFNSSEAMTRMMQSSGGASREDAFGLAALAGIAFDLEMSADSTDDGFLIAQEDAAHPVSLGGDDGGMDDGIEIVEAAAAKGEDRPERACPDGRLR